MGWRSLFELVLITAEAVPVTVARLLVCVPVAVDCAAKHVTFVRIRTTALAVCGTSQRCVESNTPPTNASPPGVSSAGQAPANDMVRVRTSIRTTALAELGTNQT